MRFIVLLALVFLAFLLPSCKTQSVNYPALQKEGTLIASLERTPCYGTCPVYKVQIYNNGLVRYEGKKFVDSIGVFFTTVSAKEISTLKERFRDADFLNISGTSAGIKPKAADLPSVIIYFKDTKENTVTDFEIDRQGKLFSLVKYIDSLLNPKVLHRQKQ